MLPRRLFGLHLASRDNNLSRSKTFLRCFRRIIKQSKTIYKSGNMDEERIRLILESLSMVEKILSAKTEVGDVERLYLSKNMLARAYNLQEFREIRDMDGLKALDVDKRYILNGRLYGKSGSLLFFTEDFRFAIKTIRKNELRCMRKMISGYKTHLLENPKSFLCRIFGCYSISDGEDTEHFIVMKNILKSPRIGEVYDLKGAFVKRRGCSTSSLKDIDWVNNNRVIELRGSKKMVISQIREDVEFLRRYRIMDYSLLICFPSKNKSHEFTLYNSLKNVQDLGLEEKYDADHDYVYFGIIDILTQWTLPKMMERFFNVFCCKTNSSCINPDAYVDRFLSMVESGFFK